MYISIGGVVYFLVGLFVAINLGYTFHGLDNALDFLVVMALWPIVLLFNLQPNIQLSSLGMMGGQVLALAV